MKKIFGLLLLALPFTGFGQSIWDDLILYYPFNGNADDASGNGYNGIPNATLTPDQDSNPNSAYSFNGTDEYITLPNDPALKPDLPITIAAYVYFENLDPTKTAFIATDFATNNHSGVWFSTSSSDLLAIGYGDAGGNTDASNRRTKIGTTTLVEGQWYHIAAVVNGPTDMELYINCVNDGGTYSGSGGSLGYTSSPGSIGQKDSHMSEPEYYFEGKVDEVMYWSRALSESEITKLCNNIASNPEVSEEENLALYPNPVNNLLQIETSRKDISLIQIFSLDGQLQIETEFTSEINLSQLQAGVYIIQFENQNSEAILQRKLVIE